MKSMMKIFGVIAVAAYLSSCVSLKPFTDEDIRQLGISVPTEQKAVK